MTELIHQDLLQLYDVLSAIQPKQTKTEHYERLADRLSRISNKTTAWKWRYIMSVANETIDPSPALVRAVGLLTASLDGRPAEFSEARQMQVMADPDRIQTGSLVLGYSKICFYPTCTISFVPVVPWGKYCPAHRS